MRFFRLTLFLILAFCLWGCAPTRPLRFISARPLGLSSTNFDSTTIRMNLVLYNPNSMGLTVKDGNMEVSSSGILLGRLIQDIPVHVPARDTFDFPMDMSVSLSVLMKYGSRIHLGDSLLIDGKGNCKLGKGGVYVTHPLVMHEAIKLSLF